MKRWAQPVPSRTLQGPHCRGPLDPFACALVSWRREGTKGALPQPGIVTIRRLCGSLTSCGCPRTLVYMGFGNVTEPISSRLYLLGSSEIGCDLKAWLVHTTHIQIFRRWESLTFAVLDGAGTRSV